MVEKHRNFVQAYLQCFDAAEACLLYTSDAADEDISV